MRNWIPDTNRFKLSGPPKWFLAKLMDFDNSLVIVPSRQGFYYRLAQRRKLQLPDRIAQEALWNESDTQMLARYGLVPVTTILATANWSNPYIFVELANRAPWRMGGAEKVNEMLDAQEKKDWIDQRIATDAHLTEISKDAWKVYRKKIGLGRSWNTTPAQSKTPPKTRVPVKREMTGFSRPDHI